MSVGYDYSRKFLLIKHMEKYRDAEPNGVVAQIMVEQIERLFQEMEERLKSHPEELKARDAAHREYYAPTRAPARKKKSKRKTK